MVRLSIFREESTASLKTITKQMFLQSSKRAGKYLYCPGSECGFSDNDYRANVSTIKQKSWQVSLLSGKRVSLLR